MGEQSRVKWIVIGSLCGHKYHSKTSTTWWAIFLHFIIVMDCVQNLLTWSKISHTCVICGPNLLPVLGSMESVNVQLTDLTKKSCQFRSEVGRYVGAGGLPSLAQTQTPSTFTKASFDSHRFDQTGSWFWSRLHTGFLDAASAPPLQASSLSPQPEESSTSLGSVLRNMSGEFENICLDSLKIFVYSLKIFVSTAWKYLSQQFENICLDSLNNLKIIWKYISSQVDQLPKSLQSLLFRSVETKRGLSKQELQSALKVLV